MFSSLFVAALCLSLRVSALDPLAGQTVGYQTDVNNGKSCLTATANANGAAVVIGDCPLGLAGSAGLPANQSWVTTGGAQQVGQLKIFGNKCLDVKDGSTANGAKLQIWTCATGNANQQWISSGAPGSPQITWANKNKCVDLTDGKVAQGNHIQIWDCDAAQTNKNQLWSPIPITFAKTLQASLKANSGLCIAASSTTAGSPVVAAACTANSAAQTWAPASAGNVGTVSIFNATLCLLAAGEGTPVAGTKLVVDTCPHEKNAKFNWHTDISTISSAVSGTNLCVDLTDGKQTAGNQLQLWTCVAGSTNQLWNLKYGF
ncbi:Carbohydrate-binding module family 13 protein [Mycena kentingensis (nom. inval.)]|nr:Carbohydrate-binding module family 13 protein [Mycena kentingensis (nom. inval.)]